jgi:hypothetical protein
MTTESLFSICNLVVLPQWLLLILALGWRFTQRLVSSYVIPLLLGLVYVWLLLTHLSEAQKGGFSSVAGVKLLFSSHHLLLAGWVHYLAFNLIIGGWIIRNGHEKGIAHWQLIPCLFFTFMLEPIEFLLYKMIKSAYSSKNLSYGNN